MTGNEYQAMAMRTNDNCCTKRLLDFSDGYEYAKNVLGIKNAIIPGDLVNGVMGLAGEAGECVDIVKKYVFHSHPLNVVELEKELGDVMWYVAMCCHALNISLDDVMKGNIDKLRKRYPDGFSIDASIHREEYQND